MRFHKAETAFFVSIGVIFLAGLVVLHAYSLHAAAVRAGTTAALDQHLFAAAVLIATAIVFGVFFIYPIIRRQVREEDKLRAMTAALSRRSETLQHAALTDPLTGMQNRRYFDEALREYLEAFRTVDKPLGLLIIDLDHFKQINDTHGHDVGDKVLREVGIGLSAVTRFHDVLARLGGEEFAIVVPNMDEGQLVAFADRIRETIAQIVVPTARGRIRVTASVGAAVWDAEEGAEEFFRRADTRLYEAKRNGRNRVSA
ncbi:MAG: GGDEF domain-containing protein [Rhizobiaceae bacterium]